MKTILALANVGLVIVLTMMALSLSDGNLALFILIVMIGYVLYEKSEKDRHRENRRHHFRD